MNTVRCNYKIYILLCSNCEWNFWWILCFSFQCQWCSILKTVRSEGVQIWNDYNNNSVFLLLHTSYLQFIRENVWLESPFTISFVTKHLSGNQHTMNNDIFHWKGRREHVLLGYEKNFVVIQYWIPNSKRWLWAHVMHIDNWQLCYSLLSVCSCKKKRIKP